MKFKRQIMAAGFIFAAFIFFNTFVMSDTPWIDPGGNIYSHDDTDRVGIGTDNPSTTLDVAGWIGSNSEHVLKFASNTQRTVLRSKNATTNNGAGIDLYNEDAAYRNDILLIPGPEGDVIIKRGNVGIRTTKPDHPLTVNGTIHCERLLVSKAIPADFVFEPDYPLLNLEEVESFIKEQGHLPEIPCAKEMETAGIDMGEMHGKLLQKIEELTLYIIEQNKELTAQNNRITELEKKLGKINNEK
jgi:hypothetical protein